MLNPPVTADCTRFQLAVPQSSLRLLQVNVEFGAQEYIEACIRYSRTG